MNAQPMAEQPALTDETTLSEVLDVLTETIPIEMKGDFQPSSLFEVLIHAACNECSIEQSSRELENVPTGNAIRHHINKLNDVDELEDSLNNALAAKMPGRLQNTKQRIAVDYNLIPYYGEPTEEEAPYIIRSQAKDGTSSFYAYATAYVISKGKRITLALHAIRKDETTVAVLTHLLDRLFHANIRIKQLFMDRGFYSVPVIRWLQACEIPFLMPAIIRGKQGGTRALVNRKQTRKYSYTMKSPVYGSVTFDIFIVGTYDIDNDGNRIVKYLAFAAFNLSFSIRSLPHLYRTRFGVECSYRQKNLCRIRSTSKNPASRLLYVGIAFLIVNLWTFIIWSFLSLPRRGQRLSYPDLFPLQSMLAFLRQAIQKHLGTVSAIFLPLPPPQHHPL